MNQDDEERLRERQERAADATLAKRAVPSEVSGMIAGAALGGNLADVLKTMLSAYGKRKKLEMERYGTSREDMLRRYETMRDWCKGVLDITNRHERQQRLDALDMLRPTMFGARFDDKGKIGERAVFPEGPMQPHCRECNDGGMVYKEIEYEYETTLGVGLCLCGHGTRRREAILTSGRKQPKKKRGEEF